MYESDVDRVRIAADLDSIYYANIKAAVKIRSQLICYDSKVTKFGVSLGNLLNLKFDFVNFKKYFRGNLK